MQVLDLIDDPAGLDLLQGDARQDERLDVAGNGEEVDLRCRRRQKAVQRGQRRARYDLSQRITGGREARAAYGGLLSVPPDVIWRGGRSGGSARTGESEAPRLDQHLPGPLVPADLLDRARLLQPDERLTDAGRLLPRRLPWGEPIHERRIRHGLHAGQMRGLA